MSRNEMITCSKVDEYISTIHVKINSMQYIKQAKYDIIKQELLYEFVSSFILQIALDCQNSLSHISNDMRGKRTHWRVLQAMILRFKRNMSNS